MGFDEGFKGLDLAKASEFRGFGAWGFRGSGCEFSEFQGASGFRARGFPVMYSELMAFSGHLHPPKMRK